MIEGIVCLGCNGKYGSVLGKPAAGLAVTDSSTEEVGHVNSKYRVSAFDEPAGAVIAAGRTGDGASVADLRSAGLSAKQEAFQTAGLYGVVP